jgi:hypothetical protein
LEPPPTEIETTAEKATKKFRMCETPGCPHQVTEPWEESGLLCYECAIEGELFDRDARWDHVCPIPGTHCLPCEHREAERVKELERRAHRRVRH